MLGRRTCRSRKTVRENEYKMLKDSLVLVNKGWANGSETISGAVLSGPAKSMPGGVMSGEVESSRCKLGGAQAVWNLNGAWFGRLTNLGEGQAQGSPI